MDQRSQQSNSDKSPAVVSAQQSNDFVSDLSISLPKGGGAILGMGEKFAASPVTGTGSLTIPIALSPGRSGYSPQKVPYR